MLLAKYLAMAGLTLVIRKYFISGRCWHRGGAGRSHLSWAQLNRHLQHVVYLARGLYHPLDLPPSFWPCCCVLCGGEWNSSYCTHQHHSFPMGVYPNPKGNRQNREWKQSNFFFSVFLPLLFMLWLELCQHGQEGQQATHLMHSLISAGWALLVFYNMNILGIFFFSYSCNTFFVMATNGLFVFFWLFILFFVMSTHTLCPVKIKSDGYWDILS